MAYELIEDESEEKSPYSSFVKGVGRNLARTASNLGTRAVGLPGDLLSVVNEFAAKPITKKITGQEGAPYEEIFLGKVIPTTHQHREALAYKTGEFFKPQNKIERFVDDVIEDTALLLNPTGKAAKIAQGVQSGKNLAKSRGAKAFYKSIGANVLGETTEQVTGSEGAGSAVKGGTLFLGSILDSPKVSKEINKLYKTAEANLPVNATTDAKKLEANLKGLEKMITKQRPLSNLAPSEKYVIDAINKTKKLIKNGKINIDQAWAQKKSFNEELTKLYETVPSKHNQQRTRKFAKQINGWLNESIGEYGKTNPDFYKPFKAADEAFGVMEKSKVFSNWVQKHIKQTPLTSGLIHILGAGAGATVAPITGLYMVNRLAYRISQSPTLRKIYAKTLKSAAKEDAAVFNKLLSDLDNKLQEQDHKEKWEPVD